VKLIFCCVLRSTPWVSEQRCVPVHCFHKTTRRN